MPGCCEDALAVFEERKNMDKYPKIVKVTIPGMPSHVYYRSENYIHNQVNSPIPGYTGPTSNAPKDFYGEGTYKVDKKMMSLV